MGEEIEVVGREAVEAALSQQYDGAVEVLPAGEGRTSRMTLRTVRLGGARLDRIRFDMAFGASGESLGGLVVAVVRRGRLRSEWEGRTTDYLPGDVCVTAQHGLPFRGEHHDTEVDAVMLDPGILRTVAGRPDDDRPVRLTAPTPVTARAAQRFRSTYSLLRDQGLTLEHGSHPLVDAAAERLLAATTLVTFANTHVQRDDPGREADAHPAALRRALAYIDDHADTDITLADVAAAAFVSVRALQLAFRRHLGTTPTAYLRRVRLEQARRELLGADPEVTTVTAVAARWGFLNASRFAAHYREAFAELPSRTLAR